MIRRANIIISGSVQGVFFRDHTKTKAKDLNLKGYVRNEPNGTVKIVVEGEEIQIQNLVDWCHKGSPSATVESVDIEMLPPKYEFDTFKIVI